jgi:hypothetical protein
MEQRKPKGSDMFDISYDESSPTHLDAVRGFFAAFGQDLAEAARLLGGPATEARVVNAAASLEAARRLDARLIRDLHYLHRMLLADVPGDPDDEGSLLYPFLDPASPTVETICIVTDALADLLESIGERVSGPLCDSIDDAGSLIPR